MNMPASTGSSFILDDPAPLVEALRADGWRVIGPKLGDGAIVYDEIESASDLPRGLTDEQEGGHYRLREGDPARWFDYVVGPQSWKKYLFPARQKLWSAEKGGDGFAIEPHEDDLPEDGAVRRAGLRDRGDRGAGPGVRQWRLHR